MNILEFKNLSKAYTKGKFVINNLNLEIPQGKIIGLLGPNGCGKSTFLKIINKEITADSGVITYGSNVKIGYFVTPEGRDYEIQIPFRTSHRALYCMA